MKKTKTFCCFFFNFDENRDFFCFSFVSFRNFRWICEKKDQNRFCRCCRCFFCRCCRCFFCRENESLSQKIRFFNVSTISWKFRWLMLKFVVFVCLIRRWSQQYHLSKNMILLILWRLLLIVSMFRCLCLFVSLFKKKRNFTFDFVKFSISRSSDVVFSSISFDVVFFSTFSIFFNALFVFSILLSVVFFSTRFFASLSNDYRDSFFVFRFRFFSKVSQKKTHVLFYFSINLKKKRVKYFSNFWKIQIRQRKLLKFFQLWHESDENSVFVCFAVSHRDWKLLCVFCVKHDSIYRKNYRKICERCEISHTSCKSICVRICSDFFC